LCIHDYSLDEATEFVSKIPQRYLHEHPRKTKMSIALGVRHRDGMTLCTDSEMSKAGGLKYNGQKLFYLSTEHWSIATAFAGYPEMMTIFQERLWCALPVQQSDDSYPQVGSLIKDIVRSMRAEYKSKFVLETISAVSHVSHKHEMWCTRGEVMTQISGDGTLPCLGVGDSSVVQYLKSLVIPAALTSKQAIILLVYMVAQAKQFIQGCGGPTQIVDLDLWGKCRYPDAAFIEQQLETVQSVFGNLFRAATDEIAPEEMKTTAGHGFLRSISALEVRFLRG
jgi:hypothetical protein